MNRDVSVMHPELNASRLAQIQKGLERAKDSIMMLGGLACGCGVPTLQY